MRVCTEYRVIGYYWVTFEYHNGPRIACWNGGSFERFTSDDVWGDIKFVGNPVN